MVMQELRNSCWPIRWLGGLVLGAFCAVVAFVPMGLLTVLIAPRGSECLHRFPLRLPAPAAAGALTLLVCAVRLGRASCGAVVVGSIFPLLGCLMGAWAGKAWLRGGRTRLWFLPKMALLMFLIGLSTGVLVWLSLQGAPLPFESAGVTSMEKRRLVHLVRVKNPESLQEGQTHTLRLTERDLNILLSWGLSLRQTEHKATVRLNRDAISLWMSMAVPVGGGERRYLNLDVTGSAGVADGTPELRLRHCRIGSREIPRWLLRSLCPLAASLLSHNRTWKPFLEATREMVIEPNALELTYGPLDLPAEMRQTLLGPAVRNEALLASTRTQADRLFLLFTANPLPDLQPSFNLCLKTAFALARDRSATGNPVMENQAALFALGILLGHPGIEEFIGPVVADQDYGTAQQMLNRVLLRGRSDWTRHFCLSAVITLLSDQALSDAAGLLKEELDAEAGGSGFSFADLLMDRAGTVFALSATRDEAAARGMQARLAEGFRTQDICPAADGLPEGVPRAELQSQYGGRNGEKYRGLLEEIERRVAACATYQGGR